MICSVKPLLKLDLIFFERKKLEKLGFKGFLVGFINGFNTTMRSLIDLIETMN